jgi:hypothetical protein
MRVRFLFFLFFIKIEHVFFENGSGTEPGYYQVERTFLKNNLRHPHSAACPPCPMVKIKGDFYSFFSL